MAAALGAVPPPEPPVELRDPEPDPEPDPVLLVVKDESHGSGAAILSVDEVMHALFDVPRWQEIADPMERATTALRNAIRESTTRRQFYKPFQHSNVNAIARALLKQARKNHRRGAAFDRALNALITDRIARG